MMEIEKAQKNCLEKVEESYDNLKDFGENVRKEYEKVYREMWQNLKASHLEPFSKILKEHENIIMKDQEELIEFIRSNLELQMQKVLDKQWQSNNVSDSLISLEMCKEKFKSYEGHKWDMDLKTPLERTRPIRMRFKENRLRYLKAQLEFQNKQLNEVMQENFASRKNIQEVVQRRVYLMESMTEFRKKAQVAKSELQEKLLDELNNDENVHQSNEKEGNQDLS